jgi:uncharacterized protein YggT (Ycf19 family)
LVQLLVGIVDPILAPIRRILPPLGGIDFSPLIAVVGIDIIKDLLQALLIAGPRRSLVEILLGLTFSLLARVDLAICVLVALRLLLMAVQSNPFHPANYFLRQISDPFTKLFTAVAKGAGGIVLAFVAYVVLYIIFVNIAASQGF